jgi:hypothetical protein
MTARIRRLLLQAWCALVLLLAAAPAWSDTGPAGTFSGAGENVEPWADRGETVVLSVDQVVERALRRSVELESLWFAREELARSKKNIYRSFFPTLSTSVSGTSILNVDEADATSYGVNLTLEQVLYDQLATPIQLQNFGLSLQESGLKIRKQKRNILHRAVQLYLDIILAEERLRNKHDERSLYLRFLELVREEHRLGMKTMLEVIDTENALFQAELELEELAAGRRILYRDLANLIGIQAPAQDLFLVDSFEGVLSSRVAAGALARESSSFDQVRSLLQRLLDQESMEERLYRRAVENSMDIAGLRLALAQNRLQQKLQAIQFLENISLSYALDFTGDRFFPANTTHTLAVNVLLDFGVLSSDVSLSRSTAESRTARGRGAESEVLPRLYPVGRGRRLRFEAYQAVERIELHHAELRKRVQVWMIRLRSLLQTYRITGRREEVFIRNGELFQVRLELGEVKQVDYLEFLIKKNQFLIQKEEVKYRFITLIWELEDILGADLSGIL